MKKNSPLLFATLLISMLACSFNTMAQEGKKLEKEADRWYQIEVILFTQNSEASLEEELWNPDDIVDFSVSPQPLYRGDIRLSELPFEPTAFTTVLNSELSLGSIYKQLSRASLTQPALHLAWIQPTQKDSKPVNVHLYPNAGRSPYAENSTLQNEMPYHPGLGFDGLVSLKRGHYLHLNIDMGYQERNQEHLSATSFNDVNNYSEATLQPLYTHYRMKQKRRIRTEEIHYFDHPRFGVIIQVTPITLPEPEEVVEEPAKPALLPIPVNSQSKKVASPLPVQKSR
jgi:hypothetical protein